MPHTIRQVLVLHLALDAVHHLVDRRPVQVPARSVRHSTNPRFGPCPFANDQNERDAKALRRLKQRQHDLCHLEVRLELLGRLERAEKLERPRDVLPDPIRLRACAAFVCWRVRRGT
jgi:hypothetical protein